MSSPPPPEIDTFIRNFIRSHAGAIIAAAPPSQHHDGEQQPQPQPLIFTVYTNLIGTLGKEGAPPASKSAIEALPTVAVTEEDDCAICLTEYGVAGDATELPCKHRFHSDCVVKWLGIHGSCPVCRYEMPVDEEAEKRRRDGGVGWQVVITVTTGGGPVGEVGRVGSGLEERNGQWVEDMDIDVHDVGSGGNWDQHSSMEDLD